MGSYSHIIMVDLLFTETHISNNIAKGPSISFRVDCESGDPC